jgi:polyhydroxyalkanoate synthase
MTTDVASGPGDPAEPPANLAKLNANIARIEELTQRLVHALSQRRLPDPGVEAPGPDLFADAAAAWWTEMLENPGKLIEAQVGYWGKALRHYVAAQQALSQGRTEPPAGGDPAARPARPAADRRFANPLWDSHPWFNFLKQQYLLNVEALETAVAELRDIPPLERRRIEFFTRQIVDMMAPTNFLATNPDALERALETEGESLVRGLENLVRDIEANRGELLVTLADRDAFKVGENIGATEGAVVFRNRMFELIQYAPRTAKVRARPLVIFPPWINKFYILDLKPANSLIRWVVDQGYTLFVVSWKNPDAGYAEVGMDQYVEEGYLTAIREVKAITGEARINAVGYCIAGTTLALALALMKKRGDRSVSSATFFTTLTDFADPGEVGVFLTDDFVDGIERVVTAQGYLDRVFMGRTFSFLRSNDLIYGPAIRSYMMGEAPPAFDLLYWNGDGTNLPARMAMEYLRGLCQANGFARGTFRICGETVSLADVTVPLCAIACETDHIAPWKASYAGIRQFGSRDKTFILAESGHIAGVVNPPMKEKYGYYTSAAPIDAESAAWKAGAVHHRGSWWPEWIGWLAKRSGRMVAARVPGDAAHPVLAPAPGSYVVEAPAA